MQRQAIEKLKIYIASTIILLLSLYYYRFWLTKCYHINLEKILFGASAFILLISLLFNYSDNIEFKNFTQRFLEEIEQIHWENTNNIKQSVLVSIVMISTLSFMINLLDIFPRYMLKILSEFYTHTLT